jgi:hypothetical protein
MAPSFTLTGGGYACSRHTTAYSAVATPQVHAVDASYPVVKTKDGKHVPLTIAVTVLRLTFDMAGTLRTS